MTGLVSTRYGIKVSLGGSGSKHMGLFESTWATCRTYKQNAVPCDKDAPAHCVRSLKGTLEARFVRCEVRLFRVECLQYIIVGLVLLNLGLMFLSDEQKIHMQDKIPAINPFQLLVRHGVWGKGVCVGEGAVSRSK